jgi:hypothetical protein
MSDVAVAKKKEKIQVVRRRAKVLEMFNRGMTQAEIAGALNVDQSTISRDIRGLSLQARDEFAKRIFRERWLELQRMTAMHDGTMKRVWELVDDKDLTTRERMAALSLLLKCYKVKEYLILSRRDDVVYQKGLEAAVRQGND